MSPRFKEACPDLATVRKFSLSIFRDAFSRLAPLKQASAAAKLTFGIGKALRDVALGETVPQSVIVS